MFPPKELGDKEKLDMEVVLGIKGQDFVLIAADTMVAKESIFLKDDQSKIRKLSANCLLAMVGNRGQCSQFGDSNERHFRLYEIQHEYPLTPLMNAHYTRNQLAKSVRSKFNCEIALLQAGFDPSMGTTLHHIDRMGSLSRVNYVSLGLGHRTCNSLLSSFWQPDINSEQAYEVLKRCISEIQNRFVINLRSFEVFIVDKNGARKLESLPQKRA